MRMNGFTVDKRFWNLVNTSVTKCGTVGFARSSSHNSAPVVNQSFMKKNHSFYIIFAKKYRKCSWEYFRNSENFRFNLHTYDLYYFESLFKIIEIRKYWICLYLYTRVTTLRGSMSFTALLYNITICTYFSSTFSIFLSLWKQFLKNNIILW